MFSSIYLWFSFSWKCDCCRYLQRSQEEGSKSKGTHPLPLRTSGLPYPSLQWRDLRSGPRTEQLHLSEGAKCLVDNCLVSDVTKICKILPASHTKGRAMGAPQDNDVPNKLPHVTNEAATVWDVAINGCLCPKTCVKGTGYLFRQTITT